MFFRSLLNNIFRIAYFNRIKTFYHTYLYQKRFKRLVQLYPSNILLDASGNQAIREYMLQKRPLLVSRLGLVELNGLIFYIEHRRQKIDRLSYPLPIMQALMNNAGFFPMEDSAVDNFCELYLQSIQEIDILGIWFHEKELKIFEQYCSCKPKLNAT